MIAIRTVVLTMMPVLLAAPISAQVRIEPRIAAPPRSAPLTTWTSKLYELKGAPTATIPDPPNTASCTEAVLLPDSLALVGGTNGVRTIDTWQVYADHWTSLVEPPTATDTLRAGVVGADCSAIPLRIWLRAGSDFVAVHAESASPNGVYVIGAGGRLTPATIVPSDATTKEIRVEAMSAPALRHRGDQPPTPGAGSASVRSPPRETIMARCLAAGRLQARAADEEMAKIHAMPGSDEMSAPPSSDVAEARDANIVSICTSMPGIFLPELRNQ